MWQLNNCLSWLSSDPLCLQALGNTFLRHNGVYIFSCAGCDTLLGKSGWCLFWTFPSIPPGTEENRRGRRKLCLGGMCAGGVGRAGEQHAGCRAAQQLHGSWQAGGSFVGRSISWCTFSCDPFKATAVLLPIDITPRSVLRRSTHRYAYPCYFLAQYYICKIWTLFERLRILNILKYFKYFLWEAILKEF